ncbi:hypothetical protein ID871_12180 [Streptomyces pratensis]|nr:hypothetical protein [Streptomyces pratensis]
MATFLYRTGRTAFRRRWLVVLLWAVVLGAVGAGAAKAPAGGDDGTSFGPQPHPARHEQAARP